MFDVVIVDDISEPPLVALPRMTQLHVQVICQERRGFGIALARPLLKLVRIIEDSDSGHRANISC